MRIQPITPVVPLRNDASTDSEQRRSQKEYSESVMVELGANKSCTKNASFKMQVQNILKCYGSS